MRAAWAREADADRARGAARAAALGAVLVCVHVCVYINHQCDVLVCVHEALVCVHEAWVRCTGASV